MVSIRMLFVIIIITCLMMAVSMWVCTPNKRERGLIKWTGGLALAAVGFAIFAARGFLPDLLTLPLATAAIMASIILCASAILEFQRQTLTMSWYIVPPLVTVVTYFLLLGYPSVRIVVGGLLFAAVFFVLARQIAILARHNALPAYKLIVGGGALGGLFMLGRSVAGYLLGPISPGAAEPDWFWLLTFFAAFTVLVTCTIGYIMLHKERAEQDVRELAMTDPLTGVYNRRTFFELAEMEFWRALRARSPLSLLMIDLDHFKTVNDVHGHPAGDAVLKHVVAVIADCLRAEDLFARYGGEEFCVLVAGLSRDDALALAERIRRTVEEQAAQIGNVRLPVRVSIGFATIVPDEHNNISLLLARADEAVYDAKRAGRNRVSEYIAEEPTRGGLPDAAASTAPITTNG